MKSSPTIWQQEKRTRHNRRSYTPLLLLTAILILICAVILLHAHQQNNQSEYERASILYVVDGDTIYVRTASGKENYVRLIGIDAPESVNPDESKNTAEGAAASTFTKALLPEGTTVYLVRDVSDKDNYGRWLRYVWLEVPENARDTEEVKTKMVNAIVLVNGHAQAKQYPPDLSYADIFEALEKMTF